MSSSCSSCNKKIKNLKLQTPNYKLQTTQDGSPTIYLPGLNEHYHSTFGAVQESEHIFIKSGLNQISPEISPVIIYEVGFGTGLNALLTLLESQKTKRKIIYHSIEKYPLPEDIWKQLNFKPAIRNYFSGSEEEYFNDLSEYFRLLHESPWDEEVKITPYFTIKKIKADLTDFRVTRHASRVTDEVSCHMSRVTDLVYFDAFGPDVQPEMWSQEIFSAIAETMKPGGILVTYSVKGVVKRALKAAGFSVSKVPGPAGKREILLAVFNQQSC